MNHNDYKKFCELSLEKISLIFQKIPSHKINKIIYTSSASIYRISENLSHPKKDNFNRELYSSFKLAAEKLIINYANKKKKEYFIMRLFNTYGDTSDEFSFIENVISSKKNNKKIFLINNGNSIRDFIHVKDIGIIYKKFIEYKLKSGIYDIGTGNGYSIKDIIDFSNFKKSKIIKKKLTNESPTGKVYKDSMEQTRKQIRYIDLCSGIGGFRVALNNVETIHATCVLSADIKQDAIDTYNLNFGENKIDVNASSPPS